MGGPTAGDSLSPGPHMEASQGAPAPRDPGNPWNWWNRVTFPGAPVTGLLPSPTALSSRGLTLRFRVCEDGVAFSPVSLCSVHGVFLLGPKSKALPGG